MNEESSIVDINFMFVKKNLLDFKEKNNLPFEIIEKNKKVILIKNNNIVFHFFVFSINAWEFPENQWVEKELPITFIPFGVDSRESVLWMKFKIGKSLDAVKKKYLQTSQNK